MAFENLFSFHKNESYYEVLIKLVAGKESALVKNKMKRQLKYLHKPSLIQ